jgi:hypothetical protein
MLPLLLLLTVDPLTAPADRDGFRAWFTFLAELQAFQSPPAEVSDCASLVRFAYREALRPHDSAWARGLGIPPGAPLPGRRAPVRSPLFATPEGERHFADARTLRRFNTRLVGRDLGATHSGDLLFFEQVSQALPFHVMVFVGSSHFEGGGAWVVYHTGPGGGMRRLRVEELRAHPEPRWRPVPGNATFLGVYRWRLLAEGGS